MVLFLVSHKDITKDKEKSEYTLVSFIDFFHPCYLDPYPLIFSGPQKTEKNILDSYALWLRLGFNPNFIYIYKQSGILGHVY